MTGSRAGIHTLAPGERSLNLDPVAHCLLNCRFEGVVIGVAFVMQKTDAAKPLVDSRRRDGVPVGVIESCRALANGCTADTLSSGDVNLRKEIPERRLCRKHDICIIHPERFVHTARAYVTHHQRQVPDQFTLNVQVPLHDVTAMSILFNVIRTFGPGGELCVCSRRERTQDRKSTRLNSSHSSISYAVFCLKK